MRKIAFLLALLYLPQPIIGNTALYALNAEKGKLEKHNKTLKNKNIELKEEKKKLEKQKRLFAITTAITGAAAVTTTTAAIINNKNKKDLNTQAESKKKKIAATVKSKKKKIIAPKKIDLTNCTIKTKTIFEAIDQSDDTELQCWLFKKPDSINQSTGTKGKQVHFPNALAYAIGKSTSPQIVLNLIEKKPDLLYTKMIKASLLSWMFTPKYASILEKVYNLTQFNINHTDKVMGSLVAVAIQSKNNEELLNFLKKHNADFSGSNETVAPIVLAIVRKNIPSIHFLFKNTEIKKNYKYTGKYLLRRAGRFQTVEQKHLLHLAVDMQNLETFNALLPYINKNTKDKNGKTALEYLDCKNRKKDLVDDCENYENALKNMS